MKTKVLSGLLLTILLTGCSQASNIFKEIEETTFTEGFNALKTSINSEDDVYKNVRIRLNSDFTHEYNYKENEYYSYLSHEMVLFVPNPVEHYTWKEKDKYYHAEVHLEDDLTYKKEITKIEFDVYMLNHKNSIMEEIQKVITNTENRLMDHEELQDYTNKYFFRKNGKQYKLESTGFISKNEELKNSYYVRFDSKKPLKCKYVDEQKNISEEWIYTYGNAVRSLPTDSRIN